MDQYSKLQRNIREVRNAAMLNLFVLDCRELNECMMQRCQEIYDSLIKHQVRTSDVFMPQYSTSYNAIIRWIEIDIGIEAFATNLTKWPANLE